MKIFISFILLLAMFDIEMVSSLCSLFDTGIKRCEIQIPLEEDETERSGEGETEKSEEEEKTEKGEREYLAASLRDSEQSQSIVKRIELASSEAILCVCLDIIVPPPEYIS